MSPSTAKQSLSIWYPYRHAFCCLHHGQHQIIESMSHILNGCNVYKGLYIARHDRIVDIITKDVSPMFDSSVVIHKHSCVKPEMFRCSDPHVFANITANSPDVIVIDENNKEVFLLEVGCTFDSSLEEAFLTKQVKYQPLVQAIMHLGYRCQLIVFIFGSLGHVHRLVVRGLMIMKLSKCRAKQVATYCSISSIIGSRSIWRRRCYLFP